jgi:hypothetical protein
MVAKRQHAGREPSSAPGPARSAGEFLFLIEAANEPELSLRLNEYFTAARLSPRATTTLARNDGIVVVAAELVGLSAAAAESLGRALAEVPAVRRVSHRPIAGAVTAESGGIERPHP